LSVAAIEVRAVVLDSLEEPVRWVQLDEAAVLEAIDAERELFVAVGDFPAVVDIARRNGRRLHGVEPVLAQGRVELHPTLAIETVPGDESCWSAAETLVGTWPRDPDLAVSASFETAEDVRARA
jgi:hypothetical protein